MLNEKTRRTFYTGFVVFRKNCRSSRHEIAKKTEPNSFNFIMSQSGFLTLSSYISTRAHRFSSGLSLSSHCETPGGMFLPDFHC